MPARQFAQGSIPGVGVANQNTHGHLHSDVTNQSTNVNLEGGSLSYRYFKIIFCK